MWHNTEKEVHLTTRAVNTCKTHRPPIDGKGFFHHSHRTTYNGRYLDPFERRPLIQIRLEERRKEFLKIRKQVKTKHGVII